LQYSFDANKTEAQIMNINYFLCFVFRSSVVWTCV